ncbi:hypothetical protein OC861_000853 [Tilletia horrida]|nr:hypothetical protein OC845_005875 [Tilletia horrida]KAK0569480.1 hypothetical protein OC861_000853 [Tilletia horrida]
MEEDHTVSGSTQRSFCTAEAGMGEDEIGLEEKTEYNDALQQECAAYISWHLQDHQNQAFLDSFVNALLESALQPVCVEYTPSISTPIRRCLSTQNDRSIFHAMENMTSGPESVPKNSFLLIRKAMTRATPASSKTLCFMPPQCRYPQGPASLA